MILKKNVDILKIFVLTLILVQKAISVSNGREKSLRLLDSFLAIDAAEAKG